MASVMRYVKLGHQIRNKIVYNAQRNVSKDRWDNVIGDREIVGPGVDTDPTYFDNAGYPCPAIRFQPNTPYIQALKEKEKCDWRNLTLEEKKCLYRASFCQTFSEFQAPTGEWKSVIGFALLFAALPVWIAMFFITFVLDPLPETCRDYKGIRWMVKRLVEIEHGIIEGLSSEWDYENWKWKDGRVNPYWNGEEDDD